MHDAEVNGVLVLVLNPYNAGLISADSEEQVLIQRIQRHLAPNVGHGTNPNPSRKFLGVGFTGTPRGDTFKINSTFVLV